MSIKKDAEILHITDIDEGFSTSEVKEAIRREARVLSIRGKLIWKSIVVIVNRRMVEALVKVNRVSTGCVMCRVRYRENVMRSFRSLKHGHRSGECKGPDRCNCFKCSAEGNRANECETPPKKKGI